MKYIAPFQSAYHGAAYGLLHRPSNNPTPADSGKVCACCGAALLKGKYTGAWYRGDKQYCDVCMAHLAFDDLITLEPGERTHGYLTHESITGKRFFKQWSPGGYVDTPPQTVTIKQWCVSCGSLYVEVHSVTTGRHNIAGTRTDVWFSLKNPATGIVQEYWGVNYGRNSEIVHIRRVKS